MNTELIDAIAFDSGCQKVIVDFDGELYRIDLADQPIGYESSCLVTPEGIIISGSDSVIELAKLLGRENQFKRCPDDLMLSGYKTLLKGENDTLVNSVFFSKKLTYKIGEWTEELTPPHIFVHQCSSSTFGSGKVYKVQFYAKDLVSIKRTELTVKKVRVVEDSHNFLSDIKLEFKSEF